MTLAELSVGPLVAGTDEERAARQAHLQQAKSDFDVLAFDAEWPRASGFAVFLLGSYPRPTGVASQV